MYEVYEKLLKEKGVRTADVAKATGIHPSTFSDWKKGKSHPKLDKMEKIANYFRVTVDYFKSDAISDNDSNNYNETSGLSYYTNKISANMAENIKNQYHVLFDACADVAPEDLEQVIRIIKTFRKDDGE